MTGDSEIQWSIYTVATIRVSVTYRGDKQKTVNVITGVGGGDCGVEFKSEEEYLIFAERGPRGNLYTEICLGTDLLKRSVSERRILGGETKKAPAQENNAASMVKSLAGGKICGRVIFPSGTTPRYTTVYAWDTRIVFMFPTLGRYAAGAEQAEVSASGSYCLSDLDRGQYWVAAKADFTRGEPGAHYLGFFRDGSNIDEAIPVEIKDRTVTGDIDFPLRAVTVASVKVRFLTPEGKPADLDGKTPVLFNLDGNLVAQVVLAGGPEVDVDSEGFARFENIPPGHYRLVVMSESGPVEGATRELSVDAKDVNVVVALPKPQKH
jgi:hypothetical protein